MNLYKLRHLHGFKATREEDSIVVENGSFKPRKTTGTYWDFGKSVNEVWSEAFLNYMLVVNILFGSNWPIRLGVRSRMGWCEYARILGVESMLRICSQYYQIDC